MDGEDQCCLMLEVRQKERGTEGKKKTKGFAGWVQRETRYNIKPSGRLGVGKSSSYSSARHLLLRGGLQTEG